MKYRGVFVPFGEYLPDQPLIGEGLVTVVNAVPLDGVWQRFPSHSFAGTGTTGYSNEKLRDATWWHDESSQRLFAATSSHLWEINPTTGALTDRCKGGHYASSTWSFLPFGGIVVAASAGNPIQSVTPGGAFADLVTSATKPRGKYLCSCRGHIILGNITAPAANPREIRWSGRYQPADWEPGSNRSGFNEFFGDVGVITGLVGFEDFFLIFTTKVVIRASFIGGDAVWSYQQIGSLHDGMPLGLWRSVVPVGRDAYYLSRTGPRVVVSGESIRDLAAGKVRRTILDPKQQMQGFTSGIPLSIPFGSTWLPSGACDAFRRTVAWGWFNTSTSTPTDEYAVLWIYNIEEGTWAVSAPFFTPASGGVTLYDNLVLCSRDLGASLAGVTGNPLQGISTVWSAVQGSKLFAGSFSGNTLASTNFTTRMADFGPGQTAIHAARLRLSYVDMVGGVPAAVTLTVRAYNNLPANYSETPDDTGTVSFNLTSSVDDRGFAFFGRAPVRGAFFVFLLSVVDGAGTTLQFRDFLGLDLLLDPEKSDR